NNIVLFQKLGRIESKFLEGYLPESWNLAIFHSQIYIQLSPFLILGCYKLNCPYPDEVLNGSRNGASAKAGDTADPLVTHCRQT
ncbi:hypothetical protein OAG11_07200, partial [Verrucomicrobia bacterium]|nr:hypothetical protein [Verrucomicrobiota bacterium]